MKRLLPVCLLFLYLCGISVPVHAESAFDQLLRLFAETGQNQEAAGIPHAETVTAFRNLGIDVPEETVREVEQSLTEMCASFSIREEPWDFPLMLLSRLGAGTYDFDTGDWTSTSTDVYSFDAEVFDIDHMYTLFLQGVSSIVPAFICTDVTEVIDGWDEGWDEEWGDGWDEEWDEEWGDGWDEGWDEEWGNGWDEGTTTVRFTLNQHTYERQLSFYGDWFNTEAIDWINEVLTAEGFDGQLCGFSDGGQGLILFYGDEARIKQLREVIPQPPL